MIAEKRKLCVCFLLVLLCVVFSFLSQAGCRHSRSCYAVSTPTPCCCLYIPYIHASIHSFSRSCMHSSNHTLPVACMCEACTKILACCVMYQVAR